MNAFYEFGLKAATVLRTSLYIKETALQNLNWLESFSFKPRLSFCKVTQAKKKLSFVQWVWTSFRGSYVQKIWCFRTINWYLALFSSNLVLEFFYIQILFIFLGGIQTLFLKKNVCRFPSWISLVLFSSNISHHLRIVFILSSLSNYLYETDISSVKLSRASSKKLTFYIWIWQ